MCKYKIFIFSLFLFSFFEISSQVSKIDVSVFDGNIVFGYADRGAFLNFTGPNINLKFKNSRFIFGMLPSLRFKKDTDLIKNTLVTPGLGFGFTFNYKSFSLQIPLYYNSKTLAKNGYWVLGAGIGLRIDTLNKNI